MKRWESLVDQKIREAMEQGEFDNLAGAGEPINLSENPYDDPDWRTAHRMLRNAGFAPVWIEERKDIDAELEATRISLGTQLEDSNECAGHSISSIRAGAMGQSCREFSNRGCRA